MPSRRERDYVHVEWPRSVVSGDRATYGRLVCHRCPNLDVTVTGGREAYEAVRDHVEHHRHTDQEPTRA